MRDTWEVSASRVGRAWAQLGHSWGGGVTVTPSASQYACRGLLPSTKGMWWKLMAGDFLSLS